MSIHRPSTVVQELCESDLWHNYKEVVLAARQAEQEVARLARHARKEEVERRRVNARRERQERKDRMMAEQARRKEARAMEKAAREAAKETVRVEKERRRKEQMERLERAKEAEERRQRQKEELARQRQALEAERTLKETQKRARHSRHKRPKGGMKAKPVLFEEGWILKLPRISGRVQRWVKDLGEWTRVQTLVRQGRRSYVQAAIKRGWVEWHGQRTVHVDACVDVVSAQVSSPAEREERAIPEAIRGRRKQSLPRNVKPRKTKPKPSGGSLVMEQVCEEPAVSQTHCDPETGDYFHGRGWP